MTDFVNNDVPVDVNDMETDEEFALHLADTVKKGCENAGLNVAILPSTGGYSMSVYNDELSVEIYFMPTGFTHTLN